MTIKDLYEKVGNLPTTLNVIDQEGNHPWIGPYDKTPEEIRLLIFSKAYIYDWGDTKQIIFYI